MMAHPVAAGRATTVQLPSSALGASYEQARNRRDLDHYFEYSNHGVELVEDGLKELPFGEFLVEQAIVDRFELFRALQMQDRLPGVRLGECAAALGYAPINAIEKIYARFIQLTTVAV